jgi:DNA-directed RNA polymerase subunit alpha
MYHPAIQITKPAVLERIAFMTTITESKIELFGGSLPPLEDIYKLAVTVNSSQAAKSAFAEQAQCSKDALASGIALSILGNHTKAVDTLAKAKDRKEKHIFLAESLRHLGKFDEALQNLDKAASKGADSLHINLEKVNTLRLAGRIEDAVKQLKACANFEKASAQYHYVLARCQEANGLYDEAMDNYRTAIEIEPNHSKALFHLAYSCDLRGDEDAAIDYYKQLLTQQPTYVNALLNLAVLYEDADEYDKADKCIDQVLSHHPNHPRAILFKKDVKSSKTMLYDEEDEKNKTRKSQILETPISDFELSVRSRNCLKKMNLYTIGDLLNITEAELLSYKNFGETSLTEIKHILNSRGLSLGMAIEEKLGQATFNDSDEEIDSELLNKNIEELQLSVRARKCLLNLDIKTTGDMVSKTEAELLGCKNFGMTSLVEIKKVLNSMGLNLRQLD